jgi:hypothetical protein
MSERRFVVTRYENKVPAMGICERCQLKFFTPDSYYGDAIGAEQYLHGKFDQHHCGKKPNAGIKAWLNRPNGEREQRP